MSPFPEKIFYIRNKGFYLDIETTKNPLNQYQVICSKEQNKSTQLWFYDNKQQSIKNYQTKGFLTKKYYGWTPSKTNLLLQTEHDYDIEIKLDIEINENIYHEEGIKLLYTRKLTFFLKLIMKFNPASYGFSSGEIS